jgi:uncharacterized protein (TIGR02246 family)
MMQWNRVATAVAAVALLTGCPGPDSDIRTGMVATHDHEAELGRLADQYEDAYNRGDAAAIADLFTSGAQLLPPNEPAVEGRNAIQQQFQQVFADRPQIQIDTRNMGGAGEMGWSDGRTTIRVTPAGQPEQSMEVNFLSVALFEGGRWRIHRLAWNTDSPDVMAPQMRPDAPGAAPAQPQPGVGDG